MICGLLGFASGGTLPLLGSIVGLRFGARDFGLAMGMLMPFLTLSSFGYVVAGWVRDATGSYDMALTACVFIMIPAMIGMAFMPALHQPTQKQPTADT